MKPLHYGAADRVGYLILFAFLAGIILLRILF